MSQLQVWCFGRLRAVVDDLEVAGLEACKVQELLVYLLLHRHRPHPREVMATLFWGDRSDAQAKKYLRQTLWQLQTSLNNAMGQHLNCSSWTASGSRSAQPPPSGWMSPPSSKSSTLCRVYMPTPDLPQEQVDALCRAVALYQGDLLEGWYHGLVHLRARTPARHVPGHVGRTSRLCREEQ